MYLHSSSELQRISLSAGKVTKAHCVLNLPPRARSLTERTENTNEVAQEQGVVEGAPETEGETQESQPSNRVITENGIVGASEYAESNPCTSFINNRKKQFIYNIFIHTAIEYISPAFV